MNLRRNKGVAPAVVIGVIALVGAIGVWVAKPKALHGESRRAEESTQATVDLLAATKKQSAEAAASVVKIGEANSQQPESPVKTFIEKEVPVALSKMEKPDPQALIDAEKRKVAVLEGKVEVINTLYAQALKHSEALEKARSAAEARRREADLRLEQKAAEHLGAERQKALFLVTACLAIGLWLYVKVTHVSPSAIAEAVSDLKNRSHPDPVHSLDSVTTRLQQKIISRINKLKS